MEDKKVKEINGSVMGPITLQTKVECPKSFRPLYQNARLFLKTFNLLTASAVMQKAYSDHILLVSKPQKAKDQ